MKSALVFLALVAFSQAGVPMPRDLDGRIINGEDAKEGEIPYQVSLQNQNSNFHFCGGSVLNAYYVITAAHCVISKSADHVQVIAGTVNLDYPKSFHFAHSFVIHKEYNPSNSYINDIALVKVRSPFVVSETLKFVPLPQPHQELPALSRVVVSGWGRLTQQGPSPRELQRTDIQIAAQDFCSNAYKSMGIKIHDTHVCAHDPVKESGSCKGDSGGPLTLNGKLIGLVSFAKLCSNVEWPTVYTRVPEYLDWINENAV